MSQVTPSDLDALSLRAHRIHEDSSDTAQKICHEVLRKSITSGYLKGQGDACLTLGAIYRNKHSFGQSYHYLNKALQVRRTIGDSNRVASVFINLGINYLEECKYDSAIAATLYAIEAAERSPNPESEVLGSAHLLLSNIFDEYLEPDEALKHAQRCLYAYKISHKEALIAKANYTLANRFLAVGRRDSALYYYNQTLEFINNPEHEPFFLADVMANKGIVYLQLGEHQRALDCFEAAEETLIGIGDYTDFFHIYLNKGALFMDMRDFTGALSLLKKAMPVNETDLDFLDRLYLYENMAATYAQMQQFDSAYLYQTAAFAVRDSIFNENKQKEVTRFQTERYKHETAQQALLTQAEAYKARMFRFSSLLLLVIVIVVVYSYFQRKKAFRLIQAQQEKLHRQAVDELIQNSEMRYLSAGLEGREEEREQIARELHDQLGSAVVTLGWQYDAILEQTPPHSAQYDSMLKLNTTLKDLYEDVRQIAHSLGSGVLQRAGVIPVLEELCQHIESGGRMEVHFSHFGMEKRLGLQYELNTLRIVQELISNVLKYAKATQLMVQVDRIGNQLSIIVEDNGIGFDQKKATKSTGNGLSNIEARLRALNGTIQFESRPMGGTTAIISIPIIPNEVNHEQAHQNTDR